MIDHIPWQKDQRQLNRRNSTSSKIDEEVVEAGEVEVEEVVEEDEGAVEDEEVVEGEDEEAVGAEEGEGEHPVAGQQWVDLDSVRVI